jgi:HlyD family secretion protein
MPRPPAQAQKVKVEVNNGAPRVWVLRDGQPVAVEVKSGASNGKVTEITGGSLREGMEVITETLESKS